MDVGAQRWPAGRRVGVVVALAAEARTLVARRPAGYEVLVTGPGTSRAADGAAQLAADGVDALLSWGTSGALSTALRPGRLLLATRVHDEAGGRYASDQGWLHSSAAALAALAPVTAPSATSARPVAASAAKHRLGQTSGCVAVDMEAAAVAAVAAARGLPFLALRSIVDPADCDLPTCVLDSLQASGNPDLPALLAGLLRRPRELADLLRLARHFNAALRALRAAAGLLCAHSVSAEDMRR